MYKLAFIYFFVLFFLYLDKNFKKCRSIQGKLVFIIHHFVTAFILFGSTIFSFYIPNLIFLLSLCILWILTNKCYITEVHNSLCKLKKDEPFNNIGYHSRNLIKKYLNIHITSFQEIYILLAIMIYDIYMIFKNII